MDRHDDARFAARWPHISHRVRKRWTQLSDGDVAAIGGCSDRLVEVLQERYGYSRARAERECASFLDELELATAGSPWSTSPSAPPPDGTASHGSTIPSAPPRGTDAPRRAATDPAADGPPPAPGRSGSRTTEPPSGGGGTSGARRSDR